MNPSGREVINDPDFEKAQFLVDDRTTNVHLAEGPQFSTFIRVSCKARDPYLVLS